MPTPLEKMDDVVLCALAKEGNREAAGVLIQRHERFIWKTALPFAAKSDGRADIDDLVQEGRIEFMRAIDRFDPSHGIKFLSFAGNFLWTRLRAFANAAGVIRLPSNREGNNAPIPLLCSFDEPVDTRGRLGKERVLADLVPAPQVDLEQNADDKARLELLRRNMQQLPDTWQHVLTERAAGCTLDEVGRDIGVTKERVRQIELSALARLRVLCGQTTAGPTLTKSRRA